MRTIHKARGSVRGTLACLAAGIPALLIFPACAARADGIVSGLWSINLIPIFVAAIAAYGPGVWLVEAYVLQRFLGLRYWRCFLYATVANIVSTGIGMLWLFAGSEGYGWKTAWFRDDVDHLAALFVRSFLVSVAEETVVVALFLVGRAGFVRVMWAVAAANGVTYIGALVLLVLAGKP